MFGRRFYIVVGVGSAAAFGIAFAIASMKADQVGQTAAGWLQALGSIGAIGVAIWIANRQHRETTRSRQAEKLASKEQLFELAIALSHSACTTLTAIGRKVSVLPTALASAEVAIGLSELRWIQTRIEALPLEAFGEVRAVTAVIALRNALADFNHRAAGTTNGSAVAMGIPSSLTAVINPTKSLEAILEHLRGTYGGPDQQSTAPMESLGAGNYRLENE